MKTMKRVFSLLLFFVAAMSVQTVQAQTNGDVNGDGKVNEQDIAAILEIMAEAGGVKEQTKYYWYIGTENPAETQTIAPILDENDRTSPGWRLIGTSIPNDETKLFDESETINFGAQVIHYIAIPTQTLKITTYGIDVTAEYAFESTVTIDGVVYYIYKSKDTLRRYSYTTLMQSGDVKEETKYYWYVGQENPASMTSISPVVSDNTSPGWRLIGDKIPTYSSSNKLWIGTNVIQTGSSLQKQYVVIPANSSAAPRDGAGNDASTVAMYNKLDNIIINNVTYKVYESSGKGFKFNLDIF